MINSISSNSHVAAVTANAPKAAATPATVAPKEDSVHLSPQATAAASKDVDHDGDSK
jgi:hypothetical protein